MKVLKRVRFIDIESFIASSPAMNDESKSSWYTNDDYACFVRQASEDVGRLRNAFSTRSAAGTASQAVQISDSMGLERHLSPNLGREITERKEAHVQVVLTSQVFCTETMLNAISGMSSSWACKRARDMAEIYHISVGRTWWEANTMSVRVSARLGSWYLSTLETKIVQKDKREENGRLLLDQK